jgi:putative endonuclease
MFFDNVLYSEKLKKRYVGSTNDVNKRLSEHNSGKSKFTKGGILWKIVYIESFETNSEARAKEKFLKSGQGRKFLDQKLK